MQACRKDTFVVETLGFDACVDHRGADFAPQLAAAYPQGIGVYFENVGCAVFDAVLRLLKSRVLPASLHEFRMRFR